MTKFLKKYLLKRRREIDAALNQLLPKVSTKPSLIHQAMRYSVLAGGKRLRPILVMAGAEFCGGKYRRVLPTACALELIHTYSLIHDDLPAMDNDDLRRGLPTNHKLFGEDIAILAGDALLTLAFLLIRKNALVQGIKPGRVLETIEQIAQASGTLGMIGGQVADIKADGGQWKKLGDSQYGNPRQLLAYIHQHKTSALITASLKAGGCLVGGGDKKLKTLQSYGECVGLAFQIKDDILDCIGDKKKLGKRGSDQINQKLTYPALYGLEHSQMKCDQLISQAHKTLEPFNHQAVILHQLADYIVGRDH